ncbi:MAG: ribonuclease R [Alphaproteobacteria bacterium]|nr:ribonuclease R [Alphaproteobacteria bacterium]
MGAREIARAFNLGPGQLPALRRMLRAIEGTGEVGRAADRGFVAGEKLPEMIEVERAGSDPDGVPLVRPAGGASEAAPLFRLVAGTHDELAPGARALARLHHRATGEVEAQIIRRIDTTQNRIVGVFRATRQGGEVIPADRRDRGEYRVLGHDAAGIGDGELVIAEEAPARRFGARRVRIVEQLGSADDPVAISRIAIATHDIPVEFSPASLALAEAAQPIGLAGRVDLRELGLVTIDGSDARDFDDAVWAAPDDDPSNPGGWRIVVAIADVAAYVTAGNALDIDAEKRGNSVYFPDRVVPMLPEALSNNLCSLVPGAERPCMAAHLWIDANGRKRQHRFERAIMRSAARLTYEAVQAARDGTGEIAVAAERLAALYGAFAVLDRARRARGALELDLVEHQVLLDEQRRPFAIVPRTRLDSHRLIEEFMILANVAAAEELEARRQPCMYRVHDAPDPEKLAALRDFFDEAGIPGLALAKGQVIRPELFNRILERVKGRPEAAMVNDLVLRSQAQAVYSPNNIGHFGLALPRYAHFTSPIRRYADLLVHRALLAGAGSHSPDHEQLAAIGEHISATERRAAAAEREALGRYRATLLGNQIGTIFSGRISGVASFGLFVTLPETGTDGLIPISTLPSDFYDHDGARHRLLGRRSGRVFALGDAATVKLVEADAVGGRLLFRIEDDRETPARPSGAAPPRRRVTRGRR